MSSLNSPPAQLTPESHHTPFYQDVNSHPNNHLLLGVGTPPRWKTEDSEIESLEDKELTFPGVTA